MSKNKSMLSTFAYIFKFIYKMPKGSMYVKPGTTLVTTAITKNKNKVIYNEILETLRKDFFNRWQYNKPSSSEGLQDLVKIKTLGTGSFGRVFLVKQTSQGVSQYYAMKCIEKQRIMKSRQIEHTLYEKRIMQSVNFPFIIGLDYCFKDNSYIYFVMPFINGGDMFIHLRRMRRFSEVISRFYASQVLLALEFLHFCDIVYRDLKPENILIDSTGYIKIGDLGFCKIVQGRTWTLCGTPEYIAPEIILSKGYGKAVDWWSFGVLLFEMNSGYPPFASRDPMMIYEKIISCKYRCPGSFTSDLQDIIKNLLQLDLSRRYGNLRNGTMDIKGHKWFKELDFIAIFNRKVDAPFKPSIKSISDTTNFELQEETSLVINRHDLYMDEFEMF